MDNELAVRESNVELAITPVMDLATAKARLAQFQEFVAEYMVPEEDFGTIPGTAKPTLLKPGADKLCELYGLSDEYEILSEYSREDWTMIPPLFDYTIRALLRSKRSGALVATGMGSCNSYEGKYRWRDLKRGCPECGQATVIKGKEEYGGGWLCWKKDGKSNGCGAKFADDDQKITEQTVGRIENEDIATLKNTILKMAKKRAKVDATLSATRSSGIFTQDMEDITPDAGEKAKPRAIQQPQRKKAEVQPEPERTVQLVSDAEREEIFKVAKEAGFPGKAEVSAFLLGQFGCKTTAEVTAAQYPKVLDAVRAWKPPESVKADTAAKGKDKKKKPEAAAPKANAPPAQIINDDEKGRVWQSARTYLWTRGTGHPDDPLHVFLMRPPLECDSVAKIPKHAYAAVMNQLRQGPQSVGLEIVK
jgi:hypothetical protein